MVPLLLLAVALCLQGCSAQEEISVGLGIDPTQLQASANCCPVGGNEPCREEDCPALTEQFRDIADGNAFTEWVIDFVSEDSENGPSAEIVFNLGQVFSIASITLLSTTQFLPHNWSLSFSLDGTTFSGGKDFSNDGLFEQRASSLPGEEPQASHFQLTISLPTMASPFPVSMAEVVVVITGSGLTEEQGCGVCVQRLTETLRELRMVIQNSSSLLPSVNSTQEDLLGDGIMESQLSVKEYEDTLLVLSVVLGVLPPLEDFVDISSSVLRLDLTLVPSIPAKLDQLRALVQSLLDLDTDTGDLEALLNMVDFQLEVLTTNFTELTATATTQGENLMLLVDELNEELNATVLALAEATRIQVEISGRNFSADVANLEQYQVLTDEVLSLAMRLLDSINAIDAQVDLVDDSIENLESLLQEALALAMEAIRQSNEALNDVQVVDDIIQQIQDLLTEIQSLNSTLDEVFANSTLILDAAHDLLQRGNASLQSSLVLLPELSNLTTSLRVDVELFSSRLSPYLLPPSCRMEPVCSESEQHADMLARNASEIVSSPATIFTLRRAREFLESVIENGQFFNYSEINQIAFLAQEISLETLNQLSNVNTTSLLQESSQTLLEAQRLEELSNTLASTANSTASRADAAGELHTQLLGDLGELQRNVQSTRNLTSTLSERTGLEEEANELFQIAQDALNRTTDTNEAIRDIEEELGGVANSIQRTRSNIEEAAEALDAAEDKFGSIGLFLNATRDAVDQFVFNVTSFIAENERIIAEIDDIIAGLADIHSRVNKINSPVELTDSNLERSYLSLQPPPGRVIDDDIQFETLDLYLWTGSQFSTPSLLFYAGPVYQEGVDDINAQTEAANSEDYFLLTIEGDRMLHLRWNLGGVEGNFVTPGFILGFSEILVTRHGTQFTVCYGVSPGTLGSGSCPVANANNGSLLFRTSNRTAFLLGGQPAGSQLGVPGSILPAGTYDTFQGQIQLLLFNGLQWGLWNIRRASATNFIGRFQRSLLAAVNTWRAPRAQTTSAPSISFDGTGYLFVMQMADVQRFDSNLRTLTITTRPNEERDGLVLYAYDRELMVSMEVAYSNGDLHLIIHRHDINFTLVDYTQESTSGIIDAADTNGRPLEIIFAEGFGFQINQEEMFVDQSRAVFFSNLSKVEVWYGGVRDDLLESPFLPQLTRAGYCGCVDVVVETSFLTSIFNSDHFLTFYLNSEIQGGFAATCLISIYTREVAFDGGSEAYLSYRYLALVSQENFPANSPLVGGPSANGAKMISFSFVAQQSDGVLLTILSGESHLVVVLRTGLIEVRIGVADDVRFVLMSSEPIDLLTQHYLLLEIGSDSYSFYLDGELQDSLSMIAADQLVSFELNTNPVSGGDPILYVGGIPSTGLDLPGLGGVLSFTGCVKDLAFNFSAMSFINTALPVARRYPSGVSYHTCPFLNVSLDPLLAVHPDRPAGRVCLSADPSALENTHGGFHRQTTLLTSNIIGLIDSSWNLSMSLRQMSDGHVLTILSAEGHMITLGVRSGRAVLSLSGRSGLMSEARGGVLNGSVLEEGVVTSIAIGCAVDGNRMLLSCSLSVNGIASGEQLQSTHVQPTFFPQLPLHFGRIVREGELGEESFIGCISNLAINGVTEGFGDVETGLQCYNATQSGYGLTGISHFSVLLPDVELSQTTSVSFQPQLDNGLVLMLTDANGTVPLLAVGMFNGELLLSNFSDDSIPLRDSVCEPENPSFYTVSLTFAPGSVEVAAQGIDSPLGPVLPLPVERGTLLLTVGNIPPGFAVPEGTDIFRFLLSANLPRDSPPPGLLGCVNNVMLGEDLFSLQDVMSMDNLLIGFCPSA